MRGHIITTRKSLARHAAVLALTLCAAHSALAKPGGEPLVLDTQTGIHSGVPGTVLQTAPLNSSGMVQMDTLPDIQQQGQPPIIVQPYVEYPGTQGATPYNSNSGRNRPPRQSY
ncbi:hypothetical protein [Caballeronia sp. BR00000012568055]|uniref:hypothetical protein n=1 Tax=Caballeronia sp. BR00000012568055 TaxID=2918761 RepID=UPI0023F8DE43|nr:hypothetical protein [Caballeronia sp. BR00000012568055]